MQQRKPDPSPGTISCPRCGSSDLTEVESLDPVVVGGQSYTRFAAMTNNKGEHPYLVEQSDKRYQCNGCIARDILSENNINAAREMQIPETCDGCNYLDRTACTLYGRVVGVPPRPLTRFCFTWEKT